MPQLIQRAPIGLLGLLDSKAGGQAPNLLSDELRAVFDIEPLFGLAARGSAVDTLTGGSLVVGVNAVPALANTDCQPGVIRHIRYLGANTDTTPAGTFKFAVGWFIERVNRFVLHGQPSDAAALRGAVGGACDFWQQPGIRPAVYVMDATGAVNLSVVTVFESSSY